MVITGQSFGAGAVAAQITSPLSKGLFRGAMMTSACNFGGAGMIGGAAPLAEGEKAGLELQKRLEAPDLAAMRNVPADRILALQEENQLGLRVSGVRAPAVIDGYFWTGTKEQAFASHQASDVPVIASSNGDDLDSARYPLTRARTVADYQAMARQMYATEADAFLQLYPAQTDADVQPMAHRAAMENGMMMNSRSCAEMQAKHGKAPVYIDTFTRKHPYAPGVKIADQNPATVGAYHTADVPYWFDTLDTYNWQRPTRVWTAYDRELTDRMAGALIALAETGSPVTPQLNWPAWTAASPQYMVFGDTAAVQTMDLKRMDWLAAHPPAPVMRSRSSPGRFHDGLRQQVDQGRVDVVAYQHDVAGGNQDHLTCGNDLLEIDHRPRHYQTHQKRKNPDQGVRLGKAHRLDARIRQQAIQNSRVQRERQKQGIDIAIVEAAGRVLRRQAQQRRVFGIDAARRQYLLGHRPLAAALRPQRDALALELPQIA